MRYVRGSGWYGSHPLIHRQREGNSLGAELQAQPAADLGAARTPAWKPYLNGGKHGPMATPSLADITRSCHTQHLSQTACTATNGQRETSPRDGEARDMKTLVIN